MHYRHTLAALGIAALVLATGDPAQAASASVSTPGMPAAPKTMTGSGAAFVDTTAAHHEATGVASASAYEFRGGVAVTAAANGSGGIYGGGATAAADAASGDTFRVGTRTPGLIPNADGLTFILEVDIITDGIISAAPAQGSYAAASYGYSWRVTKHGGSTFSDTDGRSREVNYDGTVRSSPEEPHVVLYPRFEKVSINDVFSTSFSASATAAAFATANGAAAALADFGHTLRWGGTTIVGAQDAFGNAVALPDGFRLSLISDETGFDYMNVATNPYLAGGVPEPASWVLMIVGFGALGAARRRGAAYATA